MVHRVNRQLYGIASNRQSKMRSSDYGLTWAVITEDEYNSVAAVSNNDVMKVKVIPWVSLLNDTVLYQQYAMPIDGTWYYSGYNREGL